MQHKAVLKGETHCLCTLEEGMNILDMVFYAKEALKEKGVGKKVKRLCTICARSGRKDLKIKIPGSF